MDTNNESTVIRVKQEYRDLILNDPELQGKIAKNTDKSLNTIYRWTRENAAQLTMLSVLNTIREHLQIPKTVAITEHAAM